MNANVKGLIEMVGFLIQCDFCSHDARSTAAAGETAIQFAQGLDDDGWIATPDGVRCPDCTEDDEEESNP